MSFIEQFNSISWLAPNCRPELPPRIAVCSRLYDAQVQILRNAKTDSKLKQAIIAEAPRLISSRWETEDYRAKLKAAQSICQCWVQPSELPSNSQIRDEIQRSANLFEGPSRHHRLRDIRLKALRIMRLLERFRLWIIGGTLTGHIPKGGEY